MPRFSSNAEIEVITLSRPKCSTAVKLRDRLPPIDTKVSNPHLRSFVLSSPTSSPMASLKGMIVDDDSPIVV